MSVKLYPEKDIAFNLADGSILFCKAKMFPHIRTVYDGAGVKISDVEASIDGQHWFSLRAE